MRPALHVKTKILPGNKIEIADPDFPVGNDVEVFIILPESQPTTQQSAIDLLDKMPGHRLFKTSEEADLYLQEERDSWER
ncbi:MAG: hypothetical protein AB1631_17900 [Acidobacteriota bacterium]